MSIHLLIVDDENLTREGLRNMIPWKKYGVDAVSAASNGAAALAIAKQNPPDILLADIRMPKMDGITLAKEIHKFLPRCKIVFISAYSDKEYLKSAIQIQAKQYIEKPIVLSEVESIMHNIINEILADKIEHDAAHELVHGLQEAEELVEQYIVSSLISQDLNLSSLYKKYGKLYFTWQEDTTCTPICIIPLFNNKSDVILLKNKIAHFLDTCREIPVIDYFIGFYDDNQIALLIHLPDRHLLVARLVPELIKFLNCSADMTFSIGVGPSAHVVRKIAENYKIAQKTACNYFYADSPYFFDSPPKGPLLSDTESKDLYYQIDSEPDSISLVCSYLKSQHYVNISKVQDFLYRIYIRMLKRANTEDMPISRHDFSLLPLSHVTALLEQDSTRIRILHAINTEDFRILGIARFVLNHYDNCDLSIDMIAKQFAFTPNYMSTLFKQKTGQTLNNFIIYTRIEIAKNLLLYTNLKIYEICIRVGIHDSNYFSDLFKRTVSVSPTVFRFQNLNHSDRGESV